MNADDLNFAYKVRHALNEHLDSLPAATVDRLAAARQLALSRKKPESALRVAGRRIAGPAGRLFTAQVAGRFAVIAPLLVLVVGLSGLYQYEERQRIAELAELDADVLADDLPLTAYLDDGFNAYLAQRARQ
jgi:hypothetical protein